MIVDPSGARRWIARVQVKGLLTPTGIPKRIEVGLGSAAIVTLVEARVEALEMKRKGRQGINPLQADETKIPSFEVVARDWWNANKSTWTNPKHAQQWINTMQTYAFPHIGGFRVDMADQKHVLQYLEPIWNTKHETGRRVMQRIAKVLDVATAKQYRSGENPVEIVKRANVLQRSARTQVEGHAALSWGEAPVFWQELTNRDGMATLALQFTIMTAARTSETLGALWSEVDLETATWTVPQERMKARKAHLVPLNSQALALLTRMHSTRRGELIFEGQQSGKPLSNMVMT